MGLLPPREPYFPGSQGYEADIGAAKSFRIRQRRFSTTRFPDEEMSRQLNLPLVHLLWLYLHFNCSLPSNIVNGFIDRYLKAVAPLPGVGATSDESRALLKEIDEFSAAYAIREKELIRLERKPEWHSKRSEKGNLHLVH